jgi:hypothetical protein
MQSRNNHVVERDNALRSHPARYDVSISIRSSGPATPPARHVQGKTKHGLTVRYELTDPGFTLGFGRDGSIILGGAATREGTLKVRLSWSALDEVALVLDTKPGDSAAELAEGLSAVMRRISPFTNSDSEHQQLADGRWSVGPPTSLKPGPITGEIDTPWGPPVVIDRDTWMPPEDWRTLLG